MEDFYDNHNDDFESDGQVVADLAMKQDTKPKKEGHLTIDVFQTEDDIVVQSTIAGADPDDIDVSVTKDMVTIKGRRDPEHKIKQSDYFHQELYWGPFSRAIILPTDIDADNAKATFKNGVLTISMPKLEIKHHKK